MTKKRRHTTMLVPMALALALATPATGQKLERIATGLKALVSEQEGAVGTSRGVRAGVAHEVQLGRCSRVFLEWTIDLLEVQDGLPSVYQTLQNGEFSAAAAVDADDPRDHAAETDWVAASWASRSGILWGRDYNPDEVVEGFTRLLDNTRARINAYTLSFASLTPRAVVQDLVHEGTEHSWLLLQLNGVIAGIPADENGDIGWPRCAAGMFFIDDAFNANGFIPSKYLD